MVEARARERSRVRLWLVGEEGSVVRAEWRLAPALRPAANAANSCHMVMNGCIFMYECKNMLIQGL